MPSNDVNELVRKFVQYFVMIWIGVSHYIKYLYRTNAQARIVIDFILHIFSGIKENIYGEKSKLPITEKWSEWIRFNFATRREIDVFDNPPQSENMDGFVHISKINSSTYLVNNDTPVEEIKPVTERFITVQYTHPHMGLPLTLDIPPGMYQTGNELLSSSFVYWCLKYQRHPTEYIFDENYKLELIDGNIQMLTIGSTQSILFDTPDRYEVLSTQR